MSKNSLPFVDTAQDTAATVSRHVRQQLFDWLPAFECTNCGAICEADTQYVERQAIYCEVWQCPNADCGSRFYREEGNPLSANMWG